MLIRPPNQEYPRWSVERHSHAPKTIKDLVLTITMIRSIALWSSISLLPNELLFLIFEEIDIDAIVRASLEKRQQEHKWRPRSYVFALDILLVPTHREPCR